jgi:tetratricopeptide (TPR) repeat protein
MEIGEQSIVESSSRQIKDRLIDPMESIEELRSKLAAASDEGEQSGLLDAIGIQLARQNRPLEALEYSTRALEIRSRLADGDVNAELPFASSLFNRAGHFRIMKRPEDAITSYALALKVCEGHIAESHDRRFRYAEALANALGELGSHDMAARFQGLAVHVLIEAGVNANELNGALGALAGYLDSVDNDVPTRRLQLSLDSGLLSLQTASFVTAQQLSNYSTSEHLQGRLQEAIASATFTMRYCDLFAAEDDRFATLSIENLRLVASWSTTAPSGVSLARLARLKDPVTTPVPGAKDRAALTYSARIAAKPNEPDRRVWCCSVRDFLLLIADLERLGIPSSDVHTLAMRLREKRIYPARDFSHRCQPRPPDIFISYDWRQNFVGLYNMIQGALVYMGQAIQQARPDLDSGLIRYLVFDEIGLWIDFVFIDQSARDVGAEVREIIPRVIDSSDLHFVLSDTALSRSWCCYELALFNKRPLGPSSQYETGGLLAWPLRSFVTQNQAQPFRSFRQSATTTPADKEIIEKYLGEEFPEGIEGVDLLLTQAGTLDKSVTPQFAVPPGAKEMMLDAVDKWLAR